MAVVVEGGYDVICSATSSTTTVIKLGAFCGGLLPKRTVSPVVWYERERGTLGPKGGSRLYCLELRSKDKVRTNSAFF